MLVCRNLYHDHKKTKHKRNVLTERQISFRNTHQGFSTNYNAFSGKKSTFRASDWRGIFRQLWRTLLTIIELKYKHLFVCLKSQKHWSLLSYSCGQRITSANFKQWTVSLNNVIQVTGAKKGRVAETSAGNYTQHIRKNGKGVAKHLLGNMLHSVLIPDFGCSFKVAFNNACPGCLYKLKSLSTLKLARTSIFVSQNIWVTVSFSYTENIVTDTGTLQCYYQMYQMKVNDTVSD